MRNNRQSKNKLVWENDQFSTVLFLVCLQIQSSLPFFRNNSVSRWTKSHRKQGRILRNQLGFREKSLQFSNMRILRPPAVLEVRFNLNSRLTTQPSDAHGYAGKATTRAIPAPRCQLHALHGCTKGSVNKERLNVVKNKLL